MILYHGSNTKIDSINLAMCRPYKDFGTGFYLTIKHELCNQDNKYDIVIGPVADDNMTLLFRQYENEMIDFSTLMKGMIYKRTSSQYSFHTEKSIRLLRKAGS